MSDNIRIVSDGNPFGTAVTVNGETVYAQDVQISCEPNHQPAVQVELHGPIKVEIMDGRVYWHGLSEVPTEAMLQELDKRKPFGP